MSPTGKKLSELAEYVGGRVVGDDAVIISRISPIEEAGPGDITFLANPRYARFLTNSKASAIIVGPHVIDEQFTQLGRGFLEVAQPYLAFAKILQLFAPVAEYELEINSSAHIEPSAKIGESVSVYPHAYIGKHAIVGNRSILLPGVFLGEGVEVGDDCVLHPNVVVRERCRIGNRVILHAGVVIGSDGFGYAGTGDQRIKIPQVGVVEIEDDVEIGSNTTIDRATLGRTVIGRGVKIDNLVQIAHNVTIGEHSVIAAQVGIAGSTKVGKNVTLAGQVGVVNHIQIGDGATIGPQSGVPRSVPPGALLSGGIGVAPHHEWLKVMTLLPQLPKLWNVVRNLERKVAQLVNREGKEQ
ncbi:MAG: UDP-3-O-(3-hydroxymyristoyl)glucosamine N-acyltransferase [Deltaproteobacteria bacterium]|nr:UDP-3-O-(3-hydroxymyristoyl)glucosamine N-acyltransferase [Deltaproteobacteria bacterium]